MAAPAGAAPDPLAAVRVLRADRVGKSYGAHRALVDVSAAFAQGEVSVLLGPNGAGKSTLLALLATLSSPTTGSIAWAGNKLGPSSPARAAIGYVGHEPGLYADLDARENLTFFARLHGVPHDAGVLDALLTRVGLGDGRPAAPVRTYSRGMQQRLALARALLHEPQILLFDEPGSALDPAGATWLVEQLRTERQRGRVVVLVTHDLEAAAAVADHVLILRRGRVARDETRAGTGGWTGDDLRALYHEATGARA